MLDWVEREALTATNIVNSENPIFTVTDFLDLYPQFNNAMPINIINLYFDLAYASVSKSRWFEAWELGVCLFTAHWCTLYSQSNNLDPSQCSSMGAISSKSVGSVSVSYDTNSVNSDLAGWGAWKNTPFGQQYATLARLYGHGFMQVR